jgi:signal transduction histidine kinase
MHTETRAAKRSLYEVAFEDSLDAAFVIDACGIIVQRNRAARALPDESLDPLLPGSRSGAPGVESFYRELDTHGHAHTETVIARRTIALHGRGHEAQRVVTVRDVTDGCALEAERRAHRRFEAIGHVTAGLAHDFNNLVMPILSLSALIEAELTLDATTRAMAHDIHVAAESALALVRQTLRLVRREPTPVAPVSVDAVIRDLRGLVERVVGREIDVELALCADERIVNVDRERLEQAILNLAANARDAMPMGGRLTLKTGTVTFAAGQASEIEGATSGSYVVIHVTDTGVGMTSEVRERIFERFFTTKEEGRGTGLGLCGVQRFVVESGGCLAVHSEPGRGATLVLYLPKAPS